MPRSPWQNREDGATNTRNRLFIGSSYTRDGGIQKIPMSAPSVHHRQRADTVTGWAEDVSYYFGLWHSPEL